MARFYKTWAVAAVLAVSGCTSPAPEPPVPPPVAVSDAEAKALIEGGNRFAIDLYKKLAAEPGNVVCSPYSVSAALAMTYAGARGDTAVEMAKVLGFTGLGERVHPAQAHLAWRLKGDGSKGLPEFSVANALWGQRGYGFKPEFLTLTQANYGAGLREVDYVGDTAGARKTISGWVGDQTKGKIPELIPDGVLSGDTRLVLTNAIYFKGSWLNEFLTKDTTDGKFWINRVQDVPVRMMSRTAPAAFFEGKGVQVVRLPYRGDTKSMLLIVPRYEGLLAVEGKLTAEQVAKWRASLHTGEVALTLPKFKATGKSKLGDTLMAMGMPSAFDAGKADFSGMTDQNKLFIGAVVHEAVVEVDEQGTVAAAATAVEMKLSSAPLVVAIRADRPFLFLIVDDATQAILFAGRVAKP